MEKEEQKLEQAEMEEQEAEESTPLVRKSRNGDDTKILEISAVDGEVSNGVSYSNGHIFQLEIVAHNKEMIFPAAEEQKMEESDRVLENESEAINGEQKIEEESDGVLENESEFINGVEENVEEESDDGVLENELEFINGVEEKVEEESDGVLENELEFINGVEEKFEEESDRFLENEPEFINGDQKIEEESDRFLENDSEVINGEQKPDNLVFHDKDEGVKSTSAYIGEKQILKDPGHIKFDFSSLDFIVPNNSTSETNGRYEEEIVESGSSSSNLQPSDSSSQEDGTSSKEIESAETDLINEDDLEITELDVERVIHKQTTHDLYCPNCKSCITKRVILLKRKGRIRIPVKRNKTGTAVGPKLGAVSTEDQEGEVGIDDAQVPTVDEDQPDIFRCLSCFSFFIPTGDGFKLFKKNWFKIFASNKQETAVEQGGSSSRTNVQQVLNTVIPSSDSPHQLGQPLILKDTASPASFSQGLERTTGIKATHQGMDTTLTFPNLKPSVNGGKLDMKATEAVDATIQHFDVFSADQLMESKSIQEFHINRDIDLSVATRPMKTQVTNVEYAEDGISFPQQDGLKLLITSDKGSPILKNLEKGNKPNQTVQTGDKEVIQLSPPSVSVIQASDVDGNLKISVSIPHEEQDVTATIVTKSVLENKNVDSRSSDSGDVYPAEVPQQIITETKIEVHPNEPIKTEISSALLDAPVAKGNDTVITIDRQPPAPSHIVEGIVLPTAAATASQSETQVSIPDRAGEERKIEVIKSIVYGGLAESITSISVVSSAAGGGAATLSVLALGAANLIGGLFVISHNLWDLRCDRDDQASNQMTEQKDRYKELLGRRQNFMLHAVVAIISYLMFGLVAPVVYGFSFRESDDKQLKLVVAAAASLVCIVVLAVGKAYVCRPPKPYLKTVLTFMIVGFMVSGVSYAAGELVEWLLVKLGLFEPTSAAPNLLVQEMRPVGSGWASY